MACRSTPAAARPGGINATGVWSRLAVGAAKRFIPLRQWSFPGAATAGPDPDGSGAK